MVEKSPDRNLIRTDKPELAVNRRKTIDLSGFSTFDICGVNRISLNGEYTAESLAELLIENWIPYFECHKCGRWDYCKYAKPHKVNPNRSEDIKCGVVADSLRNFVQVTFVILEKLDDKKTQDYLNGAFFFCKFVNDAEQSIGMFMDERFLNHFKEYSPMLFGNLTKLRDILNGLGSYWKEIPEFKANNHVLYLEGYSEEKFLDELRKSHLSWFSHLNVEVYCGKSNKKKKRIQMLLKNYVDKGYVIYIQGDADGSNSKNIFNSLIEAGSINEANTFVFKYDFESSIPIPLLYDVLKNMGILEDKSKEEFETQLGNENISIIEKLNEKFSIDLKPDKMEFAKTLARILSKPGNIWWNNNKFMNESELGQFLKFIQKII